LAKNPDERFQCAHDVGIALKWVSVEAAAPAPARPDDVGGWRPQLQRTWPWLAGMVVVALCTALAVWKFVARALQPRAMHFSAVTNFAGVQAQPSLSPDGRSVAFVSNRDGHYNIYVGLISGGSLIQITNDLNLKSRPSWSPDGSAIAFARLNESGIWDIWEVPALGGTPRRLILNATDPAWSPDSHSIAYENLSNQTIWVANASGQSARQVLPPQPGWQETEPRFSPDGRKIAFAARSGDAGPYGELELADLDSGKTQTLTHDGALAISPAWSPDGRFIYFASSRGGTMNIWRISADGSELGQITAGEGDDAELDISANGKRIVFSTLRENIGIAQLDLQAKPGQQSVKLLTTDPARNHFGPTYSPDGKRLAYFCNLKGIQKEGIEVADANGSNALQLVQDAATNVFPRWTPDGKYLVYMSIAGAGIWGYRRIPVSGGAPETLLEASVSNAKSAATDIRRGIQDVGGDGRLLFQGSEGKVETLDSRSGEAQTLATLPPTQKSFLLRWSPDGHSIAYIAEPSEENDPKAGLWVNDFKSPPRQVFRGWVIWYAHGPGNEIYLLEGKPDLNGVLWNVGWNAQGLARTSASVPILYNFNYRHTLAVNEFDVSPDGRHLAFQTEQVLEENIGMIENVR
jgi:Tol biopolymer transport system component